MRAAELSVLLQNNGDLVFCCLVAALEVCGDRGLCPSELVFGAGAWGYGWGYGQLRAVYRVLGKWPMPACMCVLVVCTDLFDPRACLCGLCVSGWSDRRVGGCLFVGWLVA